MKSHPKPPQPDYEPHRWIEPRPSQSPSLSRQIAVIDIASRFLMKRGFLLWGPPGSGKTSTVNILSEKIVKEHDGIVLLISGPDTAAEVFRLIRKIEPKRRIVGVMEDFDALVRDYREGPFLSLLDGEAQVDNVAFVATTNYPERLDRRFVDRPSRFDTIRYVGMPSADARRVYLSTKEPSLEGEELERWVNGSAGFSVAHLKEMIIAVKCLGQTLEEVVGRIKGMQEDRPNSDDEPGRSNRMGFGMIGGSRVGRAA